MSDTGSIIEFTPKKFEQFKKRYAEAVKNKEETFFFEGKEILTDYAKFMIIHLSSRFPTSKD